jgi:hypothetical protein
MLWNAEDYARCRASVIPYDYWCMGKEEGSRMEDRKEYQHQKWLKNSVRTLRRL